MKAAKLVLASCSEVKCAIITTLFLFALLSLPVWALGLEDVFHLTGTAHLPLTDIQLLLRLVAMMTIIPKKVVPELGLPWVMVGRRDCRCLFSITFT